MTAKNTHFIKNIKLFVKYLQMLLDSQISSIIFIQVEWFTYIIKIKFIIASKSQKRFLKRNMSLSIIIGLFRRNQFTLNM